MPSDGAELPEDPREREIFLRALRQYSDNCEPPELTPDCPYSVTTGPGVRGCGNECMDLLAHHNAPLSHEVIDVGDGLTMRRTRRPRTRRVHNPMSSAYDAREVYLRDKSAGPPSTWRLAAMLVGIVEHLETPPPEDSAAADQRLAAIKELILLIEAKGLTFDTQVLPHLRYVTGFAVFKQYFLPADREAGGVESIPRDWVLAVRHHVEWGDTEPSVEALSQGFQGILSTTTSWAAAASWDDLVNWRPPSTAPAASSLVMPPRSDDLWVTERFTKTYLSQWSVPALRSEWKYLHGQKPAPCDPNEMRVREVSANDLAKVMADRLGAELRPSEELTNMLVEPALTFLKEGRRTEAAALFEAALRHSPNDALALNNLGFCLLPDDPEEGLRHLDASMGTDQAHLELTNANRLLALVLLGRWTSACDLAETHLDRFANSSPQEAVWLWDIDSLLHDSGAAVIECDDIGSYVEALRDLAVSKGHGDTSTLAAAE